MTRDTAIFKAGLLVGLLLGIGLAWLTAAALIHQRDYWQNAYCRGVQNAEVAK